MVIEVLQGVLFSHRFIPAKTGRQGDTGMPTGHNIISILLHDFYSSGADVCATDSSCECTNTPGSFTCTCNQGFTGDGITCMGKHSLVAYTLGDAYQFNDIKISMSVTLMLIITVTLMLPVPTLLVASPVPVTRDTVVMRSHVGVSDIGSVGRGGKMPLRKE